MFLLFVENIFGDESSTSLELFEKRKNLHRQYMDDNGLFYDVHGDDILNDMRCFINAIDYVGGLEYYPDKLLKYYAKIKPQQL